MSGVDVRLAVIDAHAIWHASSATGAPAIASATTSEKSHLTKDRVYPASLRCPLLQTTGPTLQRHRRSGRVSCISHLFDALGSRLWGEVLDSPDAIQRNHALSNPKVFATRLALCRDRKERSTRLRRPPRELQPDTHLICEIMLDPETFQTNLIMPEPCQFLRRGLPHCSVIRPTATRGVAMAAVQALTDDGLFIGQSQEFFDVLKELAREADRARRNL